MIDAAAKVHPFARIGKNVTVGPWTVIGPEVEIGDDTVVGPHVVMNGRITIGKRNQISQFVSFDDPLDRKYSGEETELIIGDDNTIRQYTSIGRGTVQGGGVTRIGNNNWIMAHVYIAHDCIVGDNTIFSNNASLAGHVRVDDFATVGGFGLVHQFVHIGAHSFVIPASLIRQDVLPYIIVAGYDPKPSGVNVVGLKRREFSSETIENIKRAYKIIFRQGNTVNEAITQLLPMVENTPEIGLMIETLQSSERGIVR